VARLAPGTDVLRPRIVFSGGEGTDAAPRDAAAARLSDWSATRVAHALAPLSWLETASKDADMPSSVRGLAFRLFESGGALDRAEVEDVIGDLDDVGRQALSFLRIRVGRITVFVPALLKQEAIRLHAILRAIAAGEAPDGERRRPYQPHGAAGPIIEGLGWADYVAAGYRPAGRIAVRINAVETFAARAATARKAAGGRTFALTDELARVLGCRRVEVEPAIAALGFRRAAKAGSDGPSQWRLPGRRAEGRPPGEGASARPDPSIAALAAHFSGGAR
jgi:ATP-dependent RNA helicase SUPV3L1/SUV3